MDNKPREMMIGGGYNPQNLLAALAEGEKGEAALYTQIAQLVPSPELSQIILHMARQERRMAQMLPMLTQYFSGAPYCPPAPGMSYSVEDPKEKK